MDDSRFQPKSRVLMMPRDTNPAGTIFGGVILSYMDQAGAEEALFQGAHRVVTVAMNEVVFLEPVFVGDLVSFYTSLVRVGRTSITVKVKVSAARHWNREERGPGHRSRDHLRQRRRKPPSDAGRRTSKSDRRRRSESAGTPGASGCGGALSGRRSRSGGAPGEKCRVASRGGEEFGTRPRDVTTDTWFDLASLTKPLVTTTLSLLAFREAVLAPDTRVGEVLRETTRSPVGELEIHHLLTHSSGLPAWLPFYCLAEGRRTNAGAGAAANRVGVPTRSNG